MTGRRLDFICMSEINGEKQLFREAIKMIYITGDTHGEFGRRFNTQNFPEQKTMTKDEYLPSYHLFENGKRVAVYHPRYQYVSVYGNPFIILSNNEPLYSDNLEDYKDTEASLYIWHIVKRFEDENKLTNNLKHYRLGKQETQILLMDFPGEAG